ncbi:MAG TPA: SDR family oxidoreductase [Levilinea sp.]|nr:SDR family oxidoreductase [Levilinea sp.]
MTAVFLTGFAAPLGSALVKRLLMRLPPDVPVNCLVQIAQRRQAEQRMAEIERAHPAFRGRIRVIEGAVTLPDLGLGAGYGRMSHQATEIFHLVAVDERRTQRDLATKVNLIGIQNLLTFAERCPGLSRFHYISSCLVSGRRMRAFSVTELDKGQSFDNNHEETLFLAEMDVQRARQNGLPVTIYRPSRITGDSQSGAIARGDALYDLLVWLLSQASINIPLLTGNPYRNRVQVVPRDYVVAALAYLSGLEHSLNKVYHLVDETPPRLEDFTRILGTVTGRRLVQIWAPQFLAQPVMQADPEILSCLYHPTRYASENTRADLGQSGIHCPPFDSYAGKLVDFILAHPEIGR